MSTLDNSNRSNRDFEDKKSVMGSRIIGEKVEYQSIVYQDGAGSRFLAKDTLASNVEIPFDQLSGDENDEKGQCMSVINSKYFQLEESKAAKKQNLFFGSITVMKTIVGSGILGLPNVMKNWGIGLGTSFFIGIFLLNQYTCQLLIKNKNISGRSNLSTIGLAAIGKNAKYIVNLIVITNNIGVCMIEMVIFGTTGSSLLEVISSSTKDQWYSDFRFLTFCSALLISPLIFVKSIEKLRHVALFAIASIFLFAIATVVTFFDEYKDNNNHTADGVTFGVPDDFEFTRAMKDLPVLLLAFGYQFNLFPIYKSIQEPSDKRGKLVSVLGLLSSLALYLIVGIMGYMAYGFTVEVDYLQSLQRDHLGTFLYVLLHVSFVISTTFSFPVMFFGARNNFLSLLSDIMAYYENKKLNKAVHDDQDKRNSELLLSKRSVKLDTSIQGMKFYLITSAMYVIVVGVAIAVGDIGPIFNIIGSVDATAISYLLPCGFYIKLTKKRSIHYYFAWVIFVISACVSLTCLICNYL